MRKVKFTRLDNYKDTDTKAVSFSRNKFLSKFNSPVIASKDEAPAYVMAVFGDKINDKGNLRHAGNITVYTGIVLDVDNKGNDYTSFSDAKERLAKLCGGCAYAIHSTISHTGEKNRFRIVIPFLSPIGSDKLKPAFLFFSKGLTLGDSVDSCSYTISQPFIFPACEEADADGYKVYINFKGKGLFNPKKILAAKLTVQKGKNKKSSNKSTNKGRSFVPVKVSLNRYGIDSGVINIIKTGDVSGFNGDRSDAAFHVISELIKLKLLDNVIASILLKSNYAISERFINKGIQWTLDEISRIRDKLIFSRKRIFDGIEPYYPLAKEISVKRASRVMQKRISEWAVNPEGYFGLKLPAGIGKTEGYLVAIVNSDAKLIEVYVPTHTLANECRQRLIDKGMKFDEVMVIQGRAYQAEGSAPLCKKDKISKKLGESGISTYKTLCRNDAGEQCEYHDTCAYLAQYKIGVKVRIYTHAHLPLERGLLDKDYPDFAIIDESFWNAMIDEKTTLFENISHYVQSNKLANCINKTLTEGRPLLKGLRQKYGDDIEEVINKSIRYISRNYPNIKPNESEEKIASTLTPEFNKSRVIKLLLQQLLDELNLFPDRDESITVRYNGKKVLIARRKTITRFTKQQGEGNMNHVPVLCVDADFCRDIVKIFLPGIKSKTIYVKRNAVVTQIYSNTGAKSRYIPYGRNPGPEIITNCKKCFDDVQLVINRLQALHSKLLVVTYKALLEPKGVQPPLIIPSEAGALNFGGLRGVDAFSNSDAILIVGRNQPPIQAVESIAACLWWDVDDELKLTGEYRQEARGYRLVNGDKKGVKVFVCDNPRVQMVMEQLRECELLQGVDRIRLMHNGVKKPVYLMSNLPLNIDVDHLIKWKDMVSGGSLIEKILAINPSVVLSISPKFLAENYPEYFSTSVAKKEAALIQSSAELLNEGKERYFNSTFLGKCFKLWSYRIEGASGRNLTAIAGIDMEWPYVQQQLENNHKKGSGVIKVKRTAKKPCNR